MNQHQTEPCRSSSHETAFKVCRLEILTLLGVVFKTQHAVQKDSNLRLQSQMGHGKIPRAIHGGNKELENK